MGLAIEAIVEDRRPDLNGRIVTRRRRSTEFANMNTAATTLSGVLPVLQTPYFDDESIDFDTLSHEIDWLLSAGANGVVMAMVSETLRLSTEERRQMAEHVCRATTHRGAVVISVGAESRHTATALARHAEQCGATALMAIPPIATAAAAEELLDYYRALLRAVGIPMIVQDASGYVGRPLPIPTQARLLDEFGPQRVMFKPEAVPLGPNLTALREATGRQARVFEGSGGAALVDSFRRGIVGTMPGAELIHAMVALWRRLCVATNRTSTGCRCRSARSCSCNPAWMAFWPSRNTCWSSRASSKARQCADRWPFASTKKRVAKSTGCSSWFARLYKQRRPFHKSAATSRSTPSGLANIEYRRTTLPALSTRNLPKFHLIPFVPSRPRRALFRY